MSKVIVVDNFYDNPLEVRSRALSMKFVTKGTYPGKDTDGIALTPDITSKVANAVGKTLVPGWGTANFRISLDGDKASRHIHFDSMDWIATIYLTLDKDAKGGTAIWINKETGLNVIHSQDKDAMNRTVYTDGQDESKWQLDMVIPMRFNRMVLIRGEYWHSVAPGYQGFGDSVENGRLTQHCFFNEL
jgi:hypothetical protein